MSYFTPIAVDISPVRKPVANVRVSPFGCGSSTPECIVKDDLNIKFSYSVDQSPKFDGYLIHSIRDDSQLKNGFYGEEIGGTGLFQYDINWRQWPEFNTGILVHEGLEATTYDFCPAPGPTPVPLPAAGFLMLGALAWTVLFHKRNK